jgi:hypothetical protein
VSFLSGNVTGPVTTALLFFAGIFALASIITSMALINHYCMVPVGGLAMGHHFGTKPDGNDSKDDVLGMHNLKWKHFTLSMNASFLTWSALSFLATFIACVPENLHFGWVFNAVFIAVFLISIVLYGAFWLEIS